MGPAEVLEQVRLQPKGRASFKNLARLMGLKGERREALRDVLDGLVAAGGLIEGRRGHYRLPGPKSGFVVGRFSRHPAGYGFVAPDRPIPGVDGDLYIRRDATAAAMHGDRVTVEIVRVGEDGRGEGRVKRVLHHAQSLLVGRFHYSPRGCFVTPHDDRVPDVVEIEPGRELPPGDALGERLGNVTPPQVREPRELDGMIVTAALTEFPSRGRPARGRVVEALGFADDFGVDVEVVIRKHHLPYRFSEEALREAEEFPDEAPPEATRGREDCRGLPIVTIDGETARDFDDAVYVERLDDGSYALQVHIADVSRYVRPGSALDRDARLRGTSAYFPDRAVPMLPVRLSTDLCSLRPGVDRPALAALLTISPQGETVAARFRRTVIRSAARMTYSEVFRVLEGDAEALERRRTLAPGFRLMRELAEILMRRRAKRGAIDLDLPEPEIEFDERGRMIGVRRAERNIAHRIIEEFMLAANEAVADALIAADIAFPHRVHEPPSPKSLAEFETIARSFGHSLGVEIRPRSFERSRRRRDGSKRTRSIEVVGDVAIRPRDLQRFVESLRGRPEERILGRRLLRSFKQARYSEERKGHFALATRSYTHFTSPIRRYPDLIVHRALKALIDLDGATPYVPNAARGPYSTAETALLADESSVAERRAADAERELLDWKRAKFMEERLGDEFSATIAAVLESGAWVELDDLFIEGFVPIEAFAGERLRYHEHPPALRGARGGGRYGLGDRVAVRVDRVAWSQLRVEFSCLGRAPTTAADDG